MVLKDSPQKWVQAFGQQDVLARAIRVGLSACGPVGAIVGEFLTEFVPRQRLDRLHDFTERLAERLAGVEEQFNERLQASAAFASLTEEASIAAVQTASSERRRDLAALLRTGLSRADAELIEHQSLLRLLQQLNDLQVLILMSYGNFRRTFGDTELEEFQEKHSGLFNVTPSA